MRDEDVVACGGVIVEADGVEESKEGAKKGSEAVTLPFEV
jgi:hypothetical protein